MTKMKTKVGQDVDMVDLENSSDDKKNGIHFDYHSDLKERSKPSKHKNW